MFKYFFIGLIQGITEFLPISSSGHIVLFGSLFDLDNLMLISVAAHVGTLFAVIFCYRTQILDLIKHPKNKTNFHLLISTITTCLIVLIFNKFLEENFSTKTIIWGFLISAVLLLIADIKKEGKKQINKTSSFIMGVGQGLAVLPGISRSGTTLVFGLIYGNEKQETLNYSFLMSIPIILASVVYESFKLLTCQFSINWIQIFIVIISSFIFGILSIKLTLKLVKNNKLYFFSIYLIVLSLILAIFY